MYSHGSDVLILEKIIVSAFQNIANIKKVQFLMYTFKKALKIQNSRKIGRKSPVRSRIFPIFLEFSFLTLF